MGQTPNINKLSQHLDDLAENNPSLAASLREVLDHPDQRCPQLVENMLALKDRIDSYNDSKQRIGRAHADVRYGLNDTTEPESSSHGGHKSQFLRRLRQSEETMLAATQEGWAYHFEGFNVINHLYDRAVDTLPQNEQEQFQRIDAARAKAEKNFYGDDGEPTFLTDPEKDTEFER